MFAQLPREIRLFILGVLGAALVAVIITAAVVATGPGRDRAAAMPTIQDSLSSLDLGSFQFPSAFTHTWQLKWYPSREQQKKWTWAEVQRFWVDPRTSVLESLSAENAKKIDELLSEVK
jgi:hypothetical protein